MRIIQDRLEEISQITEDILPDAPCSFHKGRGCVDMVFVAQQLVQKAIEHESNLYVLFVDE